MSKRVDPEQGPASEGADDEIWRFRLYVAGVTATSVAAHANLKRICEGHLAGRYSIEIIDLIEHPQFARGDGIVAVPTLVRRLPKPVRKVVGDLSNEKRMLAGLQLRPREREAARLAPDPAGPSFDAARSRPRNDLQGACSC